MTSSTETRTRPAYRPYLTTVASVERLSPHFVRVGFTAPDLEIFGTAGLDQRIKLLLPLADGSFSDIGHQDPETVEDGSWYTRWRDLPAETRNPLRTYTVRRIDASSRLLTVDFVVHHDAGPAGAWADAVQVGQELVIVGPDERSPDSRSGIDWHPGTARRLLLAGDETAAPAICGILESLDGSHDVDAFIEVPTADDILDLEVPTGFRLTWVVRGDRPHGAALADAVTAWTQGAADLIALAAAPRRQELVEIDVDRELLWDSPEAGEGEFYAWMAGEAAMVKALRRHLVSHCGVDRKRVAFMGYWRLGQSERQE